MPRTVLEAMSTGRAIITTDAPGCREIAIPDVTGFRVPIEDAEALAAAISRLADDAKLRARFGAGARRMVEQQFSAQLIGARAAALYRDLASL